ncbi:MAG TPA: DUF3300 domain-containing protein [Stellaceae bacterium]|nr:DUF3300 domain-containing protein [Stellaceae bacterium]
MSATLMRVLAGAMAACLLSAGAALAQTAPAPAPAPAPAAGSAPQQQNTPVFSQEQLDQMLAPIALYPDQLLAQIFMAATYPLEIVQADRWLKEGTNAKLTGDQLDNALQPQPWDPSVKSLVPFPQVLDMMSQQLDWTQKLGDAVLAQESDVMASVQRLRQKAQSSGSLQSNQQQTVSTEGQTIIIQPANPETVYVPVYQPTAVYGAWPYPSYPPYYYPPSPYYPIATPFLSGMAFAAGVAVVGSMWGWGNCNWGGGNININNNVYNNINRGNINNGRAQNLPANGAGGRGNWQHNPQHRGGVAYRDQNSRQNFQRANAGSGSRQNYRGYDGAGNRPGQGAGAGGNRPGQGGAGANRPGQGAGAGANRPGQGAGAGANRPGQGAGAGANRPGQGAGTGANRPSQGAGANRPSTGARPSTQPGAYGGMGNGRSVNAQSARGAQSRSYSGGGGARGGGGGGARGGGGGGRGGGGRGR